MINPIASTAAGMPITPQASRRRAIIAGNGLAWFNFTAYSCSALIIVEQFFLTGDHLTLLLVVTATVGAGSLMQPVCETIPRVDANKAGKITAVHGCEHGTPWFDANLFCKGCGDPIMIVVARRIQGFSAGGEMGRAAVFYRVPSTLSVDATTSVNLKNEIHSNHAKC